MMKKYIIFLIGITLSLSVGLNWAKGQSIRITYPIDRMVIQQVHGSNTNVPIAVQLGYGAEGASSLFYYKIDKQTPTGNYDSTPINWKPLSPTNNWATDDFKGFFFQESLPKGWYKVRIGFKILNSYISTHTVFFGVGDVYFIAGQSNASGYDEITGSGADNVTNYNYDPTFIEQESANIIKLYEENSSSSNSVNKTILGLPQQAKFGKFINGNGTNVVRIYPHGRDSWSWARFASRIASEQNTPVLMLNLAVPNTDAGKWVSSDPIYQRFRSALQMYGGSLGAKAVLWQQGENDSYAVAVSTQSNQTAYLTNYSNNITNLIKGTRESLTGSQTDTRLSWYIAKVSYSTVINNNPQINIPPNSTSISVSANKPPRSKFYQQDLKNTQGNLVDINNNIFKGPNTDILDENTRSSDQRIHFTGSNLANLADRWYCRLYGLGCDSEEGLGSVNNGKYVNTSIPSKGLLPIIVEKNTSGNYVLKGPKKGNGSNYRYYFWVLNDNGIYNRLNYDPNNSNPNNGLDIPDFDTNKSNSLNPEYYTCYVSDFLDANGATDGWDLRDLQATQTFVMKNNTDAGKSLNVSNNTMSFSANIETKRLIVSSSNVIWDSADKPSWVDLNTTAGGYDNTQIDVSTNQSNTTIQLVLQEVPL